MITEVEVYFRDGCGRCPRFESDACSARRWAAGLAALRALCLEAGLEESLRWGHPCYRHAGRNLALLGAFQGDFVLTLPDGALLDDPDGLLRPAGPNSSEATTIRFAGPGEVTRHTPALRALLTQARSRAEAGARPVRRPATAPDLPEELTAALDADPLLAEAFAALTPGRQRSHCLLIAGAKTTEARQRRVARQSAAILAGKGANER